MTERIDISGARGMTDSMSEAVVDALIADDKLPADFDFRLLGIIDPKKRKEIATQDVLAALGYGEPTNHPYLTGDLPNSVMVVGPAGVRQILANLEDDYYALSDMRRVAEAEDIRQSEARQAWEIYSSYLNPELAVSLRGIYANRQRADAGMSKDYQYTHALNRVVIRDEALMGIYNSNEVLHGHGPVKRLLLRSLLLDNHPELLS